MLHFDSDYMEGAVPEILSALVETNFMQSPGYCADDFCSRAREAIRRECGSEKLDVEFLIGGTQTNATIIKCLIPSYKGVISADTGHINVHEAGAIENCSRRIIALPSQNGKITARQIRQTVLKHREDPSSIFMVGPGAVYISFPTELGTLYSRQELTEISEVCREYSLRLFVDGARLGYGLMARDNDITLKDLADTADVFYIGGTKLGCLMGEAVVMREGLIPDFLTIVKQQGAMLAKGRLLGLQFETLMRDGLYYKIGDHAMQLAYMLHDAFIEKGYKEAFPFQTNQLFFEVDAKTLKRLQEFVTMSIWEVLDDNRYIVRFVTSWATTRQSVEELISRL